MKFSRWKLTVLATALLLPGMVALGQLTSGNITGTVFDPTGATVPNANVLATNQATGVQTNTTTTSGGDYRIENLPVGRYNLTVTVAGFDKAEVRDVNVDLNQTLTTNFNLTIGHATTSVQVQESSAAIDTTTAQLQTTFETKEISDLPSASGEPCNR